MKIPVRSSSPSRPLRGTVEVPGDKSMSHRALMISALARGRSLVTNLNTGEDCAATARLLTNLGAHCIPYETNAEVEVEGCGVGGFHEADGVLDAGNSGTTLRTMLGICAGIEGWSVLSGDASLRTRPMLRVVAPLRRMGARIDGRANGDRAPLAVRGGDLVGMDLELSVASAQLKTAVLFAGLAAEGRTTVTEPGPSRDHTERMLAAAGASLSVSRGAVVLDPTVGPEPMQWDVPGDISSAVFLLAAATLVPGSDLTIENVGLNPTRSGALEVMRRMGAAIEVEATGERGGEPVGWVRARASDLSATSVEGEEVPSLIDELPLLAVLAASAEGRTVIRDAAELRVKESDRIAVMTKGLRILGVDCEATPDGMIINGPAHLAGGTVDSRGDHRTAMSFAVAGLVAVGSVKVEGWSCVNTSFPEFLDILGRAQGRYV
ncbi:MAG: 3-phosphoshikimate 1-carboxyvinyltransferase [Actinomycetota bacterium]|nr:3-phosphoshikimate 1-carboxyvinyltransferase [Actinomycetota bacterium]